MLAVKNSSKRLCAAGVGVKSAGRFPTPATLKPAETPRSLRKLERDPLMNDNVPYQSLIREFVCVRRCTLFGTLRRTGIASGVVPKSMGLDQALLITSTSRAASTMSRDTVEVSLISSTRAICVSSLTTRRQVSAGDAKMVVCRVGALGLVTAIQPLIPPRPRPDGLAWSACRSGAGAGRCTGDVILQRG